MKRILIICLLLHAYCLALPQTPVNKFTINNKQNLLSQPPKGTIEKATLTVRPKGIFMDCSLYLTFSARGLSFGVGKDSLIPKLEFQLPTGSIMHDSWLWDEQQILRAKVLDYWTYNPVTPGPWHLQFNPSTLRKPFANQQQYELTIFPLSLDSTRRVKISWLQPGDIFDDQTRLSLPFDILKTSKYPVDHFGILVWTDNLFQIPELTTLPHTTFTAVNDPQAGLFYQTTISPDQYNNLIQIQFASPLQDGYYLSTYSEGGANYYQLAVSPRYFTPAEKHLKMAVLIDYESGPDTYYSTTQVLETTQRYLKKSLSPRDSFNLFCSGTNIQKVSNRWMPADPDTIAYAFAGLANPVCTDTMLKPLLTNCIKWVQNNGPDGRILLVSNGRQYGYLQASDSMFNYLKQLLDPMMVQINPLNFNTNTVTVYSNMALLLKLKYLSNGIYGPASSSLDVGFNYLFTKFEETLESFELVPQSTNGTCSNNYTVINAGLYKSHDNPILQIGKYTGQPPFNIQINSILPGQSPTPAIQFQATNNWASDTLAQEMWSGRYIEELESGYKTTAIINDIVSKSINGHVLSTFTSLVCLDTPEFICDDCDDETQYTDIAEIIAPDSILTAYPNPFVNRTIIQIKAEISGNASFEIYDLKGQLIRSFDLSTANEQSLEWDGTKASGETIAPGLYVGMLKYGQHTKVLKMVKME